MGGVAKFFFSRETLRSSMPVVEEILYPALEDYSLDLMIGSGPGGEGAVDGYRRWKRRGWVRWAVRPARRRMQ